MAKDRLQRRRITKYVAIAFYLATTFLAVGFASTSIAFAGLFFAISIPFFAIAMVVFRQEEKELRVKTQVRLQS